MYKNLEAVLTFLSHKCLAITPICNLLGDKKVKVSSENDTFWKSQVHILGDLLKCKVNAKVAANKSWS